MDVSVPEISFDKSQSAYNYFEMDEMRWFAPSQFSTSLLKIVKDDPEETEET
jgi:hypothetical protein